MVYLHACTIALFKCIVCTGKPFHVTRKYCMTHDIACACTLHIYCTCIIYIVCACTCVWGVQTCMIPVHVHFCVYTPKVRNSCICINISFHPFLSLWCVHASARLRSIEGTIQGCTNTLYRACANASPQDMNDAMIGVSQQVNIMSRWINVHMQYMNVDMEHS
jgi:hypothetical protein